MTSQSKASAPVGALGLFDILMLVIGSMIGSGIFLVPAAMARELPGPGILLLLWVLTGCLALAGAFAYAELGAMMPQAGGQYAFLRRAYGDAVAFVFGWSILLVIQTCTIAAVATAFARFAAVFWPGLSAEQWLSPKWTIAPISFLGASLGPYHVGLQCENSCAIAVILLLTWINTRGVRTGALLQNGLTVIKLGSLLLLIGLGFWARSDAVVAANWSTFFEGCNWAYLGQHWHLWALAMVGAIFSADSWNNVTFAAAEMRQPARDLPKGLVAGVLLVLLIYLLTLLAYLQILPFAGAADGVDNLARGISYAQHDRVATAMVQQALGAYGGLGTALMAISIMISTFGCINGVVLGGARVTYAMAKDGLFFRPVGRLNRYQVPEVALWLQGIWASVLCLTGSYKDLLEMVTCTILVFHVLTVLAMFSLRFTQPNMPRPYRCFGYPWLPGLYVCAAITIIIQLLLYRAQFAALGLLLAALGFPVYLLWRLSADRGMASTR